MVRTRMMKTALAYRKNRMAPVFDTAHQIHVVEAEALQSELDSIKKRLGEIEPKNAAE